MCLLFCFILDIVVLCVKKKIKIVDNKNIKYNIKMLKKQKKKNKLLSTHTAHWYFFKQSLYSKVFVF